MLLSGGCGALLLPVYWQDECESYEENLPRHQRGGPFPKNSAVGELSKVILFPVTVIRGPFLKITTLMSSGGAASGCGPQPLDKTTAGRPPRSSSPCLKTLSDKIVWA